MLTPPPPPPRFFIFRKCDLRKLYIVSVQNETPATIHTRTHTHADACTRRRMHTHADARTHTQTHTRRRRRTLTRAQLLQPPPHPLFKFRLPPHTFIPPLPAYYTPPRLLNFRFSASPPPSLFQPQPQPTKKIHLSSLRYNIMLKRVD